jgi:hypothetical protein
MSQSIRTLRARELKLLQDRTRLQRQLEEALGQPDWKAEQMAELDSQRQRIDGELAAVRAQLRELERNGEPDGNS